MGGESSQIALEAHVSAFSQLGSLMKLWSEGSAWPGFECGLSEDEYNRFDAQIQSVHAHNGWFTEASVRLALEGLSNMLKPEVLNSWLQPYDVDSEPAGKTVGLIFAGNIPLVGFHDLMCTLLSGNKALVKYSSQDEVLPASIVRTLITLNPMYGELISRADGPMKGMDAVIATGSNNTSRYFEYYFKSIPHVIRKNRNSVAIIDGSESEDELQALGRDIFDFFGMGCRSVSKLFIPRDYDLDTFFKAIYPFHDIVNHNKYANNYDYIKAIWLLNEEPLLDNGFVLLKEDSGLASPTGTLFYERYEKREAVEQTIQAVMDDLQCVVGKNYLDFGQAQHPGPGDYADGLDTMSWLTSL